MNKTRIGATLVLAAFAVFAAAPALVYADATFTAAVTVGNTAPGVNDQTDATTPTQANVAETKATRTITVNSVPTVPVTLTIGTCVITVSSAPAADADCSNNNATIATSTDTTAAAIAARIRTFTGLSDTGHGALTIGGSGSTASFTTTGTETSATPITATLSTGSDFTLTTVNTTGVIPVAQINTVTIGGTVETGDTYTVHLPGPVDASYTVISSDNTTSKIANGLRTAILASAGYGSQAFTAATSTNTVVFTAKTAGTGFTQTSGTTNYPGITEQATFTPNTDVDTHHNYLITINGTSYSANAGSLSDLLANLLSAVNASSAVSCSNTGSAVLCSSSVQGTSFTAAAGVSLIHSSGNSGGGGGGSTHTTTTVTTTSNSSVQDQINAALAKVKALQAQLGTGGAPVSAAFSSDLTIGSNSLDVKALQVWLNSHGFTVSASGAGSMGNETTTFGGLTKAALAKFQASVGISPAAGYFGAKTRAYLAAHS